MKTIFLTGSSGFVASNLKTYLSNEFEFHNFNRSSTQISHDIVIHLAAKAHDLKNVSNPDDYYTVNTELSKVIFDAFLESDAKVFITLSSVKAIADVVNGVLSEEVKPNPITHYGKSKLLAEQYILSKSIPKGKRVFILRPCMIHGPGNKGNLNLLYNLISRGIPWPLGAFENFRSFLSIENLCFIIKELIQREDLPSGVYNVADDVPLSTNELINMIAESMGKKAHILNINTTFVKLFARLGDFLSLGLNTERLQKLTESYIVDNSRIKKVLCKSLPVSSKEGLLRTFYSYSEKK